MSPRLGGWQKQILTEFKHGDVMNILLGWQTRKWKRYALFCEITQRILAVSYRRFGTNYRSSLQGFIPGDQMKKGPVKDKDLWTSGVLHTWPSCMGKRVNFVVEAQHVYLIFKKTLAITHRTWIVYKRVSFLLFCSWQMLNSMSFYMFAGHCVLTW